MKSQHFGMAVVGTLLTFSTLLADVQSLQAIVQNDTDKPIVKVRLSFSNSNRSRTSDAKDINGDVISPSNPLEGNAGKQATLDLTKDDDGNPQVRRWTKVTLKYRFEGDNHDRTAGPYTVTGNNRYMLQVRIAVIRTDNKYYQVQIEDVQDFTLADMKDTPVNSKKTK